MKLKIIILVVVFFSPIFLMGQDFVYTPVNPAFGGNALNGSWLLTQANSQNTFQDPQLENEDLIANFEESFNQQFLSQLTRELIRAGDIFGEGGIQVGTFEIGNLLLDIVPGINGLIITINDIITGSQTQITVPYF